MLNLPFLFKAVREAHGISQNEISECVKKSQAAIAQFENMNASLSTDTLIKIAPLLNLNPEYIMQRMGNPFKQRDINEPIRMFLPEAPTGIIDLTIFRAIAEYNQNAIFLFIKPNIMGGSLDRSVLDKRLIRSIRQGLIFGLLIEDSDDNIFLFRKKNKDVFFEPEPIKDMLREIASKRNKYFEIDDMRISLELYEDIKNGSSEIKEIKSFLFRRKSTENRLFIMRIINRILSHPALINDYDTYRRIKDSVEQEDYKELKRLVDKIIPQFAEILKNEV